MTIGCYNACSGEKLSELVRAEGAGEACKFLHGLFDDHMYLKITNFLDLSICFDPWSHGLEIKQAMWAEVKKDLNKFSAGRKDADYSHPYNFVYTIWRRLGIRHVEEEKQEGIAKSLDEIGELEYRSGNGIFDDSKGPLYVSDLHLQLENKEFLNIAARVFDKLPDHHRIIFFIKIRRFVAFRDSSRTRHIRRGVQAAIFPGSAGLLCEVRRSWRSFEKMKYCNLVWADLDTLTDREFDAFLDHTLLCHTHEQVLLKYEKSVEPLVRAAFEFSLQTADNNFVSSGIPIPAGPTTSRTFWEHFAVPLQFNYFASFSPLKKGGWIFTTAPVSTFLLLVFTVFLMRISDSQDLSRYPLEILESPSIAAPAGGDIIPVLPGEAGIAYVNKDLGAIRSDAGTGPHVVQIDETDANSRNEKAALRKFMTVLDGFMDNAQHYKGLDVGSGSEYRHKASDTPLTAEHKDPSPIDSNVADTSMIERISREEPPIRQCDVPIFSYQPEDNCFTARYSFESP